MKTYYYGTREYFEEEVQKATMKQTLIMEAITARLQRGAIKADASEFELYATLINEANDSIADATKKLNEFLDKQNAENAAKANTTDTEGDNA